MNSEKEREELIALAEKSGFVLNPVGQLVVPAPHDDATPYLRRFLKLALSTEAQPEVTGAVAWRWEARWPDGRWMHRLEMRKPDMKNQLADRYTRNITPLYPPSAIEGYAQELAKRLVREKLEEAAKLCDNKAAEFKNSPDKTDCDWTYYAELGALSCRDTIRALMESPHTSVEEPAN